MLKPRGRYLATLGALVLVTALATDAFVQASVSIKTRTIAEAGTAVTSVCHNYTLYSLSEVLSGNVTAEEIVAEPSVEGAIYAAILDIINNPSALDVIPACSTSNCAFGIYNSLGVRSQCQDLTDSMGSTFDNNTYDTIMSLPLPEQLPLTLTLGQYETPYINLSSSKKDAWTIPVNEEVANQTMQLLELYGMGSWDNTGNDTGSLVFKFQAFSCRLDLIMEKHNTSVVGGETKDSILNTSDVFFSNGSYVYTRPNSGDVIGMTQFGLVGVQTLLHDLLDGSGASIFQPAANSSSTSFKENWTDNAVQGIYNNGIQNINVTFQGIASALTNNMMRKAVKP